MGVVVAERMWRYWAVGRRNQLREKGRERNALGLGNGQDHMEKGEEWLEMSMGQNKMKEANKWD